MNVFERFITSTQRITKQQTKEKQTSKGHVITRLQPIQNRLRIWGC